MGIYLKIFFSFFWKYYYYHTHQVNTFTIGYIVIYPKIIKVSAL